MEIINVTNEDNGNNVGVLKDMIDIRDGLDIVLYKI